MLKLFTNIGQLVQPHADEGTSREPVTVTRDAAILVKDGRVLTAGTRAVVMGREEIPAAEVLDLGGRAVVPGFVDSHTHVVFAGDRIDEMGRRARGETYESIAKAGGGIVRSVQLLEAASVDELVEAGLSRVRQMVARGTTTVEVKTGYGLMPELERKHLEAITRLRDRSPIPVLPTLLAHVVPHDYRSRDKRPDFMRLAHELLREVARRGDVRYFDVFVDDGAFTSDEARSLCTDARALGFELKLHVDQLREGGGAALAADLGALSADHLENVSPEGRARLAERGVVACILPACVLFLGKGPWPDGRALRDAGCEVAIATDCNPGSSPTVDLALCAILAVTQGHLTHEEALWGITRGGAKALKLEDRGRLVQGERADLVVVDHADYRALFYSPGAPAVREVWVEGSRVGDR